MPTPFEIIRDEFNARIERLNACITISERNRRERKIYVRNALTDSARVFVLFGDRAHMDRGTFMDNLCDTEPFLVLYPPTTDQFAALGGTRAVYNRIKEGGLGIDGRLGVWTGGFFRGLRMSGALRPCGKRQWSIWENTHRDLIRDMEEMTAYNRLERKTGRNGIRRLRRCPASFLPAEPEDGASVVAGLFAGSNIKEANNEDWIEVSGTDEVIKLLDGWGILWRKGFMFRGRPSILVPPFYAPLFYNHLPPYTMEKISTIKNPALCPLLPAIYWDLVLRKEYLSVIPFTDALPYSCSMRTFRRKGWQRKELHLTAVRMGINIVAQRLGELMRSWYESKVMLRTTREGKTPDEAPMVADQETLLDNPCPFLDILESLQNVSCDFQGSGTENHR